MTKAVAATAASTFVLSVLLFLFLHRQSRRRRDRRPRPNPYSRDAAVNHGEFKKFNGDVKGFVVDEDGLDVLYWRSLEGEDVKNHLSKEVLHNNAEEKEKRMISLSLKRRNSQPPPVQEIPLLRDDSSSLLHQVWPEVEDGTLVSVPASVLAIPAPPPPPPPPLPKPPGSASSSKPPPPPPKPPGSSSSPKQPPAPKDLPNNNSGNGDGNGEVKLKPLHWDKVNPNINHSMVWHKIEGGSFRFDDELMQAMFGYVATNRKSPQRTTRDSSSPENERSKPPSQIVILDARKSQNTAIVLRSLAVSRQDLIDALIQGQGLNEDTLEKLTRIAPTKEEESEILAFAGDATRLADAESFLFHLLRAVPSAFARFNSMLFRSNYDSEVRQLKVSTQTLELGCEELRTRGLFIKLLEAILKAGNRMNAGTSRGNAQAFNLTALRKLSDVRSSDGKTTLLNFVVEEVIRAEGKRCVVNRNRSLNRTNSNQNSKISTSKDDREREYLMLGLPVVGGLSAEFSNVKNAATIDYDALAKTCSDLAARVAEIRQLLTQCGNGEGGGFERKMKGFLDAAEEELKAAKEEQTRVMQLVRRTTEYYQAGASKDLEKHPLQLFVIVRDFLGMVDQVCANVSRNLQKRKTSTTGVGSSSPPSPATRPSVKFPVLPPNFMSDRSKSSSSESDDDDDDHS